MDKKILESKKKLVYDFVCDELYVPMKVKEFAAVLQVPKAERKTLEVVLDELVQEGKLEVSSKGKYHKAKKRKNQTEQTGVFTANAKGFGFVTLDVQPEEEPQEDIFIPSDYINGAMHMDTVSIEIKPETSGKRREGKILKVLSRGTTQIVGTYEASNNFGFVVPDNTKIVKDIFIPKERSKGAISGHKVVAEITNYGKNGKKPEGKIIEIIGHVSEAGTDIMAMIKAYDLPTEFSTKLMKQAENVGKEVSASDMAGRMDLRNLQMVTIDGEDAKDLDDAVSLTMEDELYVLGVHIADVSNYVQENSALDMEALKRGTSVYLVDRVIPMLPRKLSNGICSLNQGENRLALSCIMKFNEAGELKDYKIAETVICVDKRLSYTGVRKILVDKDPLEIERCKELVPMLKRMEQLAGILRKKRLKRGSIDFDFPESKIILDEKGKPIEIKPYERNVATKMIEDFMLAANETVASDYFWQEIPFVYRTHDNPDPEKIQKLATFINNFGYTIRVSQDEIHPKELQKLLMSIDGTDEEPLISRLTLRSMKQARYTTECTGHFGLAAQYYCHFTSPIRRYPDLQIHRIIKENLRNRMNDKKKEHFNSILPEVAKHSSEMERKADEIERETNKLKKVEFMQNHIGEEFEGVISSVTKWGMYVELPNTIEGMIHVTALKGDYFEFFEDTYEMVGQVTNKHYKLGEKVKIRVVNTDTMTRTIDFELVQNKEKEKDTTENNDFVQEIGEGDS